MKRKILLLLLILAAVCLCACGPGQTAAPSPEPTAAPEPTPDFDGLLRISELMVRNTASLPDENGDFPDWVEVENISGVPLGTEGWALTDRPGDPRLPLTGAPLQPGERRVFFCGPDSFSLSAGETLCLLSPDGRIRDRVLCADDTPDRSLSLQPDGSFLATDWISPGYPNGTDGYESFCAARRCDSPLQIWEVMVSNLSYKLRSGGAVCDWVELRNVSDTPIELSGYSLSDDPDLPERWTFPAGTLQPGESVCVLCDSDYAPRDWEPKELNTGFPLDSRRERLFLYRGDGTLADYAALRAIPLDCSLGRESGRGGFLYFSTPTPGADNSGGARRISAPPVSLEPGGVFDGAESASAAFSAAGEIRYTLDGSVPDASSPLYTGPLVFFSTGIIRAVAIEPDALPSPVVTESFILNEGHTLPVLSLVVADAHGFSNCYTWGDKSREFAANLTLYDGEHSFSRDCGLRMQGWTSLSLPKKSMGVVFRDRYGGDLEADVFGNGITRFHSLSIRAGQDYTFSIFRNELIQELVLEGSDVLLTQASKFCILYLNGEYRGIYCLKEDISKQYYASHRNVSKDSVENLRGPLSNRSELFRDVIEFSWNNDLSLEENYRHICDLMDIDSLVDWFLFESYCSNTDIQGNVRYMRSPENGNRWEMVFYDLDWSFQNTDAFCALLEGKTHSGTQMPPLIMKLCWNEDFRGRVLTRYAELLGGVLSNEHVLRRIDEMQALLEPEVPRDRERWGLTMHGWYGHIENLRTFIRDYDWATLSARCLSGYLRLSPEERYSYFGF